MEKPVWKELHRSTTLERTEVSFAVGGMLRVARAAERRAFSSTFFMCLLLLPTHKVQCCPASEHNEPLRRARVA